MELTKLQEAWLHDLETTDAKQTRELLHKYKGGYCCLGRACVVAGLKPVSRSLDGGEKFWFYDNEEQTLPHSMMTNLGLRDIVGSWPVYEYPNVLTPEEKARNDNSPSALTDLNDSGFTFKEIAAIIRRTPEAFFGRVSDEEV